MFSVSTSIFGMVWNIKIVRCYSYLNGANWKTNSPEKENYKMIKLKQTQSKQNTHKTNVPRQKRCNGDEWFTLQTNKTAGPFQNDKSQRNM